MDIHGSWRTAFDLAISADLYHWIPPEVGYPKVARALKPSESATFFWNVPVDPDTDRSREIDEVHQRTIPGKENPDRAFDLLLLVGIIRENFKSNGCFGEVTVRVYSLSERLTSEHYIKRAHTYSSLRELNPRTKETLCTAIKGIIDEFDGVVKMPRSVALFMPGPSDLQVVAACPCLWAAAHLPPFPHLATMLF